MRTKTLYTRDAEKAGISRFPNFHRTGNITGMKQLYYGKNALLVRCGSQIYNVSSEPEIYYNMAHYLVSIMKRASYKNDFQSWKGIMALKLLCCNIVAGRFDWKKYCTPQSYCGQEICVVPLHCSYGQIGYTVHFPYSDIPEVEYDWEMNKLTIDKENWESYLT